MTVPDPADTFSGRLPSLPPATRGDSDLTALHPWVPWDDDRTEATPFFTRLINQCGVFATMFAVQERERAKAVDASAVPVRHFMRPLPEPALPAIPAVVYDELDEKTLTDEWENGPGAALLAAEPGSHRRTDPTDPNDWFFTQEAS